MTRRAGGWVAVVALATGAVTARGETFGPAAGGSVPDSPAAGLSTAITVNLPNEPVVTCFQDVMINGLSHPWVGQLRAKLTHNGVTVDLFSRVGSLSPSDPGDASPLTGNYTFAKDGISFVDTALATPGPVPAGSYVRSTANAANASFYDPDTFAAFEGLPVNGTWTLTLSDHIPNLAGSFTTWTFSATAVASTFSGPGGAILDGFPPGVISVYPVNVPGDPTVGQVVSVKLLGLTHTFLGDLHAKLFHFGMEVELFSHVGATPVDFFGDSSNLSGEYTFIDTGASFLAAAQAGGNSFVIPPGSYGRSTSDPALPFPFNPIPLSSFSGMPLNGDWVLSISDDEAGDVGAFTGWVLTVQPQAMCGAACVCPQTGMPCPSGDMSSCPSTCTCPNGMPCPNNDPMQCGDPCPPFCPCPPNCPPPCTCSDGSPCPGGNSANCPPPPCNCPDGSPCPGGNPANCPPPCACPDGSPCPGGDSANCPPPPCNCPDGVPCPGGNPANCPPPCTCPDGSPCPGGDSANCPPPPPPPPPPEKPKCDKRCHDTCTCKKQSGKTFGDPVNLFSGEFYETVCDLRIPGRGLDFELTRTYRSRNGLSTVQGNGWDHWYNLRLQASGGDLVLCDGAGRCDTFALQPDGTWLRPDYFRELSQNVDGSYSMTLADKTVWAFNAIDASPAAGKIVSMTDRNGNAVTFEYDAAGRLWKVRDALNVPGADNRVVTFAHNADGRLATVTDWAGRQLKYAYYLNGEAGGSAGDLKSVTTPAVSGTPNGNDFPNGKTTVYTYSKGFADERLNHNLLTITDAKGQTYLTNLYAATQDPADPLFDHVAAQVYGDGRYDFVYKTGLTPSPANNGAVMKTIINNRAGDVKELFFDAANRLVIERAYTGRAPNPGAPTDLDLGINVPVNPLRSDDPPVFETRYEWDANSQLFRTTFPNGNVVENTFDLSNPNPRARGNLLLVKHLPGLLGGDQAQVVEQFEYDVDFGGCCGHNFVTKHTDGRGGETHYDYDALGNLFHIEHRIPSIVEDFEYNTFGQQTAHVLPANGAGHRRRDEQTYYTSGPMTGYLQSESEDADGFAMTTTREYDAVGNLVRRVDPRGHDMLFTVNALNQVVRETSRPFSEPCAQGPGACRYHTDTWYDANNNVVRVDVENVDETGAIQANGHFTTVHEYDVLNRLTRTCQEVGSFPGAIPGPVNLPACVGLPDAEFVRTEYAYDANDNRTLVRFGEAAEGRQPANVVRTLFDERDLTFRVIRAEGDPQQSTAQYDYDGNGNLTRTSGGIEDAPRVTLFAHDGFNRQTVTTDPLGNLTTLHYDGNGNVVSSRSDGQLSDVPGSAGNVRLREASFVYDAMDRATQTALAFFDLVTQAPLGDGQSLAQTAYSDDSQVVSTTDDNGHTTLTAYDTANRRKVETDAKGNTTTFTYDVNSNVVGVNELEKSDLGGPNETFVTSFAYDPLDRQTQATDSAGNVTQSAYDSRGNRVLRIDALGNVTRFAFDGLNRSTTTTRFLTSSGAGGGVAAGTIVTTQTWDDSSRLTVQSDDSGNATTSVYDALDRKVTEQTADGTLHDFTFDVHDNRVGTTDANGSVVAATFDLLDRLVGRSSTPGPGVSSDTTLETFAYDGRSRLVLAQGNDALVTRSHDSLSNAVAETQKVGVSPLRTVTATFDGMGNRLSLTYPGGRVVNTVFDALDREHIISDQAGSIASFDFVGPARTQRRTLGNGTRTDLAWDGQSGATPAPGDFGVARIVRATHTRVADGAVLDDRAFTWDGMLNQTSRSNLLPGGLAQSFSYDSAYRMVQSSHSSMTLASETIDYGLDGVGNRDSVSGPEGGDYFLDDLAPPADLPANQYTSLPLERREYDANGNLVRRSATGDFNADGTSNLADHAALWSCRTNPGATASAECRRFDFDLDGDVDLIDLAEFGIDFGKPTAVAAKITYDYRNRMVEYVDGAVGQRHTYAYDALGRRIRKVVDADGAAAGPFETRFYCDGWREIEEQDAAGATLATYVHGRYIDELLTMQRDGQSFFYHSDDLYNTVALSDAAGTIIERVEYADYGAPVVQVFEQPASQDDLYDSDTQAGPGAPIEFIADDVTFVRTTHVTGMTWLGGYVYNALIPASDDFLIRIFTDASGLPGTLLREEHVGDHVQRVATGQTVTSFDGDHPEFAYQAAFSQPFDFAVGARYWIAIINNSAGLGVPTVWGWENSSPTTGVIAYKHNGGAWFNYASEMAFTLVSDRSAVGNPFLFTGRRLDPETGWYDYRTRYLDPLAGRFTTRDTIGAWGDPSNRGNGCGYVADAPWSFLDPFGRDIEIEGDARYKIQVQEMIEQLKEDDPAVKKMIEDLEKSKNKHVIRMPKPPDEGNSNTAKDGTKARNGTGTESVTAFNPDNICRQRGDGPAREAENRRDPRVALAHELTHAWDNDKGTMDDTAGSGGVEKGEEKAVRLENRVRAKTGDPVRTTYGGQRVDNPQGNPFP